MTRSAKRLWSALNLGGLTIHEAAVRTWRRILHDAVLTRAAAISFYAFAALVPFMGLCLALSAHWLPWVESQVAGNNELDVSLAFDELLPADAIAFIRHELRRLREAPALGWLPFGLVALVWLSSSVFVEIIDAMNFILGVRETRSFLKRRGIAIVMTISQAAILIAAVVSTIAWPQIVTFLNLRGFTAIVATVTHQITVFVTVLSSFALALYVAPDAEQEWEWITPGSLLGTIVLLGFSLVFRAYTQHWGNYSATYGSLAGIIVFSTWLWLSSVFLLTAAELNKVIMDASLVGKSESVGPLNQINMLV
jgi:membrane protein